MVLSDFSSRFCMLIHNFFSYFLFLIVKTGIICMIISKIRLDSSQISSPLSYLTHK